MFDPTRLSSSFGQVGNVLAAPFVRWDSIHYLEIARHGYTNTADTSFFPLYPLLTRGLSAIIGSDAVAGVLISLVAFAIALSLVYRLTQRELDRPAAQAVVLLLAFAPLSFFFSAVYTESLFLALSVGAVYSARCERWGCAAALVAAAALTRNTGILLIAPVGLMYLGRHGLKARGLLLVMPSVVALAGFLFYLHGLGYGWLAPLKSEAAYGRQMIGPLAGLDHAVSGALSRGYLPVAHGYRIVAPRASGLFLPGIEDLILLAVLGLSVLLLLGAWRELPTPYFVYAPLVLPDLSLQSGPGRSAQVSGSIRAYDLSPVGWSLARWSTRRRAATPVLIVGGALTALYAYEFATWGLHRVGPRASRRSAPRFAGGFACRATKRKRISSDRRCDCALSAGHLGRGR